jgi:hypothetical protein
LDGNLVAVIIIDKKTASVFPEYKLPKWAHEQLAKAAIDIVIKAAGEVPKPERLKEIKTTITLH